MVLTYFLNNYYYYYYYYCLLYAGYLYIYSLDNPKEYNVAAILSLLCMVPVSIAPALLLLLLSSSLALQPSEGYGLLVDEVS
jgi:hypothetical protein